MFDWVLNTPLVTLQCLKNTEVVVRRCYVKKMFLKTWRNSQERTFARISFLISCWLTPATLLKRLWHRFFPVNFAEFYEHLQKPWLLLKILWQLQRIPSWQLWRLTKAWIKEFCFFLCVRNGKEKTKWCMGMKYQYISYMLQYLTWLTVLIKHIKNNRNFKHIHRLF